MVKIKCKACGEIGYTAAPDSLICSCGGRFKVIPENGRKEKVQLDNETARLFDTTDLIK